MSSPSIPLRYWNFSEDDDRAIPPGGWKHVLPLWWSAMDRPGFSRKLSLRMSDGSLVIVRPKRVF